MVSRSQEVSTDSEEILHDTVNRREPLELSGRLETPHLALPLTRRLVGDLGSIVRVLISDVDHGRHHDAGRGGVGAQLVGDQSSRDTALGFQQRPKESDGCSPIPVRLHEDVQDVTVLVDRAPQILSATLDRDEHLLVANLEAIPAALGGANRVLADSGYATGSEVSQLAGHGVEVLVATGGKANDADTAPFSRLEPTMPPPPWTSDSPLIRVQENCGRLTIGPAVLASGVA